MLLSLIISFVALAALVWSADRFVTGSAALALHLGMTPMTIGLTLVALGTSAPEILVAVIASIAGSPGLAIGNVLGSNAANIGLVLATTLLLAPMVLRRRTLRQDMPVCVLVTLFSGALLIDGQLDPVDGGLLLAVLGLLFFLMWFYRARTTTDDIAEIPEGADHVTQKQAWLLFATGLLILLASARALVWSAAELASALGISEAIIGLTLVAIGTSLPELAAAIASARKGHADLALGNIIGSNILNLLTVLPAPALLAAGEIEQDLVHRDLPVVVIFTLALMMFMLIGRQQLARWVGVPLLLGYCLYMAVLYHGATG